MGRKKIQIQRITDERNRQVTFTKRKFGLMKKAYELSVLCDCEIALIIFNHSNKLFQYASTDMDKVLLKYTEYNEPHESRTNADIIESNLRAVQRLTGLYMLLANCLDYGGTEEEREAREEDHAGGGKAVEREGLYRTSLASQRQPSSAGESSLGNTNKHPPIKERQQAEKYRDSPEPDGDDSIDQSPLQEDKYRKSEELDILFKRYGALNKKEHRDSESPDPEEPFSLTPRTEEKYKKIDEEFDKMMQSYRLSTVPGPTFSMPVTVPVSNQSSLPFSNPSSLVTTSFITSTLTDPRLLSPQQPQHQRNTVSPGLPQRPASAGAMLGGDLNNSNGGCPSPVGNGYVSARASPGLLSVSNGNSMGKVVPAKSPPPPSTQMVNIRKPDLRVITSQSGKGLMQLTDEELELNSQRIGSSQVSQSLTTPVVSVATPSLLTPFSMATAYNTDKQNGEMAHCISGLAANLSVTSQGSLLFGREEGFSWPVGTIPHGATLTVNTNPNISIKSEPVSPNRDRSTPSSTVTGLTVTQYPTTLRMEPTGRSPVDSISSNGSSYEGSDRDDGGQQRPPDFNLSALGHLRASGDQPSQSEQQESANVKRMRLDAWVT
ncbi:Myocyte-specific enhancer factor 2D -like protein [Triplophysa tibetana]|uniref:Myocyte-specific enhancer factor 2D-like protein n=1 Tax=Triplophysa tibetana TaxID=1572043 RepID=A0A5A9N354_9TELE|nr:Myocyte-specific enhancer factor 2D -like protein [Triplophysa tibetana]